MQVQPYLFFEGRCEEAVEFYRKALGAKVEMLTRYSESPDQASELVHGHGNKVMHVSLEIAGNRVHFSDGFCSGQPVFQGFSLTITLPDSGKAERLFKALADGGKVSMPLAKTFFSPCFGMLEDRFGVGWMIMAPAASP